MAAQPSAALFSISSREFSCRTRYIYRPIRKRGGGRTETEQVPLLLRSSFSSGGIALKGVREGASEGVREKIATFPRLLILDSTQ